MGLYQKFHFIGNNGETYLHPKSVRYWLYLHFLTVLMLVLGYVLSFFPSCFAVFFLLLLFVVVVCCCCALSLFHNSLFSIDNPTAGWWEGAIGPGDRFALDTNRYRIISISNLVSKD